MNYIINQKEEYSPSHKHKSWEIIVIIEGEGALRFHEKETPLSAGKIIIVPPGILHETIPQNSFSRIYINGDFDRIFGIEYPTVITDNEEREGITLTKMIYQNRHCAPEYSAALITALEQFILQRLKMDNKIIIAINDIINQITLNFHDCNFNMCMCLKSSGYAEDYIRAHFKKHTGKTPTEFLTEVRISHAKQLMDFYKGTLLLFEIAEKCGYTDYVYFSRKFKDVTGISPSKYISSL